MSARWRLMIAAFSVAIVIFCAATARLFIWPARGMPAHVSAIVMLAGPGDRLKLALQLARERRAPYLVVSRGHDGYGGPCPRPVPRVRLICFEPNPASTRGEAEYVGRLARKYHWGSITLVATAMQDYRARLRVERCFAGPVYVKTVGLPWTSWPGQILYEWAATIKMLAWQRSC
ncbi:MAG: YdcF family protein [Streptosporangiaceae bacterium]